jgi:hypothetical protein
MNPEALRQLLNQVPEEHRPWFLSGIITGVASLAGGEMTDHVINEFINPVLSSDEAAALEAVSMVLTEAPPIR